MEKFHLLSGAITLELKVLECDKHAVYTLERDVTLRRTVFENHTLLPHSITVCSILDTQNLLNNTTSKFGGVLTLP